MKTLQIGILVLGMAAAGWSQADNTKMNKGDGKTKPVTAEQQMENSSDLELTRKIRKAVTDDSSLSTYARNVKIITRHGKVTLKGPVNSGAEKQTIEGLAKGAAGADSITNQIQVVPAKKAKKA